MMSVSIQSLSMDRRRFLTTSAAACSSFAACSGFAALGQAPAFKPMIIELRRISMRNNQESMVQRTNDFFGKSYLPALQRAGVTPVGAFGTAIGQGSPSLLLLSQYSSLAAWEEASNKLAADSEFQKANDQYLSGALQYTRVEVSLLRTGKSVPQIEVPQPRPDGKTRIFEVRTYESNNPKTLARKIRMFDEGEMDLFRKLGMTPIFFGETIAGQNMPNLTYMLAYDDLAAREKVWSTFVNHPEWKKMSTQPGVSNAEIVSSISNYIVQPAAFSGIR